MLFDRSLYICYWIFVDGWFGVGENKFWIFLGFGINVFNVKIFSFVIFDVVVFIRGFLGDMDVFVMGIGG